MHIRLFVHLPAPVPRLRSAVGVSFLQDDTEVVSLPLRTKPWLSWVGPLAFTSATLSAARLGCGTWEPLSSRAPQFRSESKETWSSVDSEETRRPPGGFVSLTPSAGLGTSSALTRLLQGCLGPCSRRPFQLPGCTGEALLSLRGQRRFFHD